MFQRCSRNGHQCIDRNGVNTQLCKADCHIQTILPGLSHSYDATGTCTHSFCLYLFQSFNLHIVCMCRTYIRKISPRSLNIMMVTGYSGFMKTMQLFGRKKSHGSTEIDIAFLIHGFIGMNRLIKFFSGQSLSCSDNGKTVNALLFIHFTCFQNLFLGKKIIDFTGSMVVY